MRVSGAAAWVERAATPRRIICVAWGLCIVYAYPGYMSADSVLQLLEARHGPITDWHPPLMAIVWRWLDRVIAGPFPMLVLQTSLFLVGLARMFGHVMSTRRAAIAASAVALFPPVLTSMGVIWKDSQMAALLVAATACVLSERRLWKAVGCGLFVLATAQRYNAAAATLPLVVLLFAWHPAPRGLRRYARATVVWGAVTLSAFGLNRAFTQVPSHAWHGSVALFDIAGTVRYADELDEHHLARLLAGMALRSSAHQRASYLAAYTPTHWWPLVHGERAVFEPPSTAADRAAIGRTWRRLVGTYPRAYLAHRWAVFKAALGIARNQRGAVWDRFLDVPESGTALGSDATHSKLQRRWLDAMLALTDTVAFRLDLWLLLALAMVPLAWRHRLPLAVLASGLAFEASLLVAAPSRDFRYSHWMVVATVIAVVTTFVARWHIGHTTARSAHARSMGP